MGLVTKTKFAGICTVSKPAITRAIEAGKLEDANGKIDTDSKKAQKYMKAHDAFMDVEAPMPAELPLSIEEQLELLTVDQLDKIETLEKVKKLQIDNAIKLKNVVSKKIVDLLIDKIDETLNRIILDGRASFVPRLCKKVRAGGTDEELALFWNDEITKYIAPAKTFMIRTIRKFERDKK
jgi:hypothetical protein